MSPQDLLHKRPPPLLEDEPLGFEPVSAAPVGGSIVAQENISTPFFGDDTDLGPAPALDPNRARYQAQGLEDVAQPQLLAPGYEMVEKRDPFAVAGPGVYERAPVARKDIAPKTDSGKMVEWMFGQGRREEVPPAMYAEYITQTGRVWDAKLGKMRPMNRWEELKAGTKSGLWGLAEIGVGGAAAIESHFGSAYEQEQALISDEPRYRQRREQFKKELKDLPYWQRHMKAARWAQEIADPYEPRLDSTMQAMAEFRKSSPSMARKRVDTIGGYLYEPFQAIVDAVESAPYMIAVGAATTFGGPTGGYAAAMYLGTGQIYKTAREAGANPHDAAMFSLVAGPLYGAIEVAQVNLLLRSGAGAEVSKTVAKTLTRRVLNQVVATGKMLNREGFEEVLQGVLENITEYTFNGEKVDAKVLKQILHELGQQYVQGGIVAGILGSANTALQYGVHRANTRNGKLFASLVEQGVNPQTAIEYIASLKAPPKVAPEVAVEKITRQLGPKKMARGEEIFARKVREAREAFAKRFWEPALEQAAAARQPVRTHRDVQRSVDKPQQAAAHEMLNTGVQIEAAESGLAKGATQRNSYMDVGELSPEQARVLTEGGMHVQLQEGGRQRIELPHEPIADALATAGAGYTAQDFVEYHWRQAAEKLRWAAEGKLNDTEAIRGSDMTPRTKGFTPGWMSDILRWKKAQPHLLAGMTFRVDTGGENVTPEAAAKSEGPSHDERFGSKAEGRSQFDHLTSLLDVVLYPGGASSQGLATHEILHGLYRHLQVHRPDLAIITDEWAASNQWGSAEDAFVDGIIGELERPGITGMPAEVVNQAKAWVNGTEVISPEAWADTVADERLGISRMGPAHKAVSAERQGPESQIEIPELPAKAPASIQGWAIINQGHGYDLKAMRPLHSLFDGRVLNNLAGGRATGSVVTKRAKNGKFYDFLIGRDDANRPMTYAFARSWEKAEGVKQPASEPRFKTAPQEGAKQGEIERTSRLIDKAFLSKDPLEMQRLIQQLPRGSEAWERASNAWIEMVAKGVRDKSLGTKAAAPAQEAAPTPQEGAKQAWEGITVQRIDEPGVVPQIDKPQGLYTTPAATTSPFTDLGGERNQWTTNPKANVLDLTNDEPLPVRKGAEDSGAGVHALKRLTEKEEFSRINGLSKLELSNEIESKFPDIDTSGYIDKQDLLEVYGASLAKEQGYDAIWLPDKDPRFTEYVALTDSALTEPLAPAQEAAPARRGLPQAKLAGMTEAQAEAFKKWFGKSQVVDEQGKPLQVLHATDADFEIFGEGEFGFHFARGVSQTDDVAFNLALRKFARTEEGEVELDSTGIQVIPVYLSIQNPFEMPTDLMEWNVVYHWQHYMFSELWRQQEQPESFKKWTKGQFISGARTNTNLFKPTKIPWTYKEIDQWDTIDDVHQALTNKGFDGIRYVNLHEGKREVNKIDSEAWIALEPTQIKSAIGNIGTFSPTDPRIRYKTKPVRLPIWTQEALGIRREPGEAAQYRKLKAQYTPEFDLGSSQGKREALRHFRSELTLASAQHKEITTALLDFARQHLPSAIVTDLKGPIEKVKAPGDVFKVIAQIYRHEREYERREAISELKGIYKRMTKGSNYGKGFRKMSGPLKQAALDAVADLDPKLRSKRPKLDKLADWFSTLGETDAERQQALRDVYGWPESKIAELRTLNTVKLSDLSIEQIRLRSTALAMAEHVQKTKQKLIDKRFARDLAGHVKQTARDIMRQPGQEHVPSEESMALGKGPKHIGAFRRWQTWDSKTAVTLFQDIAGEDSEFMRGLGALEESQRNQYTWRAEALAPLHQAIKELGLSEEELKSMSRLFWGKRPEQVKAAARGKATIHAIKGPSGRTYHLTSDERIDFLLHALSPANMEQLAKSPMSPRYDPTMKIQETTIDPKTRQEVAGGFPMADFQAIVASATPAEITLARAIRQGLDTIQERLNQAWRKIFGWDIATDPDYWTLPRNSDYRFSGGDATLAKLHEATMTESSIFKERVDNKVPVFWDSAFAKFNYLVNLETATAAYAPALRDLKMGLGHPVLKQAILRKHGRVGLSAMNDFVRRIDTLAGRGEAFDSWIRNLRGRITKVALLMRPGDIGLRQFVSITFALNDAPFSADEITQASRGFSKETMELMLKYSPIIRERARGNSLNILTPGIGGDELWRNISGQGKKWRWTDGGIHYVDLKALSVGWSMFLARAQKTNLNKEAQYEKAARDTEDWIHKSQPIFDILHRSAFASTRGAGQLLTAFTSQTNQIWNMVWRGGKNLSRARHEARILEQEAGELNKEAKLQARRSETERMNREAAENRAKAENLRKGALARAALTWSLVAFNAMVIQQLRKAGRILYGGPRPPDEDGLLEDLLDTLEGAMGFIYGGDAIAGMIRGIRNINSERIFHKDYLAGLVSDLVYGTQALYRTGAAAISGEKYKTGPRKGEYKFFREADRAIVPLARILGVATNVPLYGPAVTGRAAYKWLRGAPPKQQLYYKRLYLRRMGDAKAEKGKIDQARSILQDYYKLSLSEAIMAYNSSLVSQGRKTDTESARRAKQYISQRWSSK